MRVVYCMSMERRRICFNCCTDEDIGFHMYQYFNTRHRGKTFLRFVLLLINQLIVSGLTDREDICKILNCQSNVKCILTSLGSCQESFKSSKIQKYKYFLLIHLDFLFEMASQYESFDSYLVIMNHMEIGSVDFEKLFRHFRISFEGDIRTLLKGKPRSERSYSPTMFCKYLKRKNKAEEHSSLSEISIIPISTLR